jgi:hypothetical protein
LFSLSLYTLKFSSGNWYVRCWASTWLAFIYSLQFPSDGAISIHILEIGHLRLIEANRLCNFNSK